MNTVEKILGHLSGMSATALAFIVVLAALAVVWKALAVLSDRNGPKNSDRQD